MNFWSIAFLLRVILLLNKLDIIYKKHEIWHIDGKLHREDGPVKDYANGYKVWYKKGVLHREDGPTIIMADGTEYWYKNGKFVRISVPCKKVDVEYFNAI